MAGVRGVDTADGCCVAGNHANHNKCFNARDAIEGAGHNTGAFTQLVAAQTHPLSTPEPAPADFPPLLPGDAQVGVCSYYTSLNYSSSLD
jgi:hypothetical protein